ncbi:winged helix-turn-helix domain-containing protein [Granulicella mallensis]|uniref:DNA-binding winged helix-turn-helix (WHTH) protein/tetratricopeptide (TPR) repeat protein n=1 Tax=Granulicella mallensis TaxID=940614 RepID=A0A7W7ZQW4_9BACT|nr:winged helix-turn-helix domain-containing protein [Granulicella mallensis]MBB5064470.1 DNA-binding winged helix-turn-helix (wHTH) protein/tetratricopeptide (TPR) repeat protein [Granulicella mallensis]
MGGQSDGKFIFSSFEFRVSTGELFRRGHKLRLPDQNARLLTVLLKHPGTVLGRHDLRSVMWPDGEHLNHDHAITNSINQLRAILRDNSRSPSYIETIPKRGYRFIAEVRFEPTSQPAAPLEEPGSAVTPAQFQPASSPEALPLLTVEVPDLPPDLVDTQAIQDSQGRRPFLWYGVIAILVAGMLFGAERLWVSQAHPPPQLKQITLGIAPIEASGDEAQSIAEPFRLELVDAASQLPGVVVRAAHSFGSTAINHAAIPSLTQGLQLDTLLLGRIATSAPNHFDFTFELVRGSDAVHLATFHYSGTKEQLGTIRSQIQRDLFLRLSDSPHSRLNPIHSTENTQAYSEYLQGRQELLHPTDEAIGRAIQNFRHATNQDASFVQAFSGLGSAYLLRAEHSSLDRDASYAAARAASLTAIHLDPRTAEAHATLGFLYFRHDWNAVAAETELKQAIDQESGQALHRIMYALVLGNTGRFREALEELDKAQAADPLWPPIYLTEIYLYSAARDNARALEAAQRLQKLMPDWPLACDQNAWAFWYAGRHEEAIREWIHMATLEHDALRLKLEQDGLKALSDGGTIAYARLKLASLQSEQSSAHPNDFQPAEWQLNAGEPQQALKSMESMVHAHDPEALQFAASPAYFSLHGDPAFNALLTQIGLPLPAKTSTP